MATEQVKLAATGSVVTRTSYLKSIIFEHSAAATLDVRAGGASGTVLQSLRLGGSGTEVWASGDPRGVGYPGGIHATLSAGTAAFEYA